MTSLWNELRRRFPARRPVRTGSQTLARSRSFERLEQRQPLAADLVSVFALAGNDHQTAIAVAIDAAGNRFVAGHFKGTVDLDPDPVMAYSRTHVGTTFNSFDAFIAKYAADGELLWARQIAGSNAESHQSVGGVTIDPQGDAWVVLSIDTDTTDLGSGFTFAGVSAPILAKFDNSTGATEFARSYAANTLSVYFDAAGSRFLSGAFSTPTIDLGGAILTRSGNNARDGFVAKYDTNGSFVWAHQFNGSVYNALVQTDALGNVIVAGELNNRTDVDPGNGRVILSAVGEYVVKLNPAGNFVWADSIAVSGFVNVGTHIVDAAGNIYLSGSFYGSADFDPSKAKFILTAEGESLFLAKLNANGTFGWAKKSSGGSVVNVSVVPGPAGQFYVGGIFSDTVDFDPSAAVHAHTGENWGEVFVVRYDTSGNYVWSAAVSGPHIQGVYGPITVDPAGDVVLVGDFRETTDFDPGPGSVLVASVDHRDAFILTLRDTTAAPSPAAPADTTPTTEAPRLTARSERLDRTRRAAVSAVFAEGVVESWRVKIAAETKSASSLRSRRIALRPLLDAMLEAASVTTCRPHIRTE